MNSPVVSARSSTSARCTPIASFGTSRNRSTASSNATPFATMLHAVTMPLRCASIAPAVMPGSRPTSSAVTINFFTHLRIERPELAKNLEDHRRRREVRRSADARKIIEPHLLDGEAAVLRLHDQLRVDQRPLRLQLDRLQHFAPHQLEREVDVAMRQIG